MCNKLIFVVLTICLSLLFSACKSYDIPYDQKLEGKTVSAGLYIFDAPLPSVQFAGSAFVMLAKAAIHSSDIKKAYIEADLREIFYEELQKNGVNVSQRVKISMKNPVEKSIVFEEADKVKRDDPKNCELVFDGIPEKLGRDYLFTIKILNYGFSEGSYSISSNIEYVASISDMRNNVKIWQLKSSKTADYPMFSSFGEAKNPASVKVNLRDCVIGILQEISADLNKPAKG